MEYLRQGHDAAEGEEHEETVPHDSYFLGVYNESGGYEALDGL